MIVKKADIVAIAAKPHQYPEDDFLEIAFAGRSNVGKSSLLNLITNRKKLAKVSGNPGKTRTINFFEINEEFRIVDLPGYGYARVSKELSNTWGKMIETYLEGRENLIKVAQLIDIRHAPTKLDIQMYNYLKYYGLDGLVVATKADKIPRSQLQKHLSIIRKELELSKEDIIIPVSTLNKSGHDILLNEMDRLLAEAREERQIVIEQGADN